MKRTLQTLFVAVFVQLWATAQTVEDARSELRKGNPVEAKKILESVLKADEKNPDAHYWLGMVFLRREVFDADEAVDHMEEAVDLNPNNADYQYGLGAALGTKARDANPFTQAWLAPQVKSAFERAVELNPNHIGARGGLADFYQMAPGIMGGDDEKAWQQVEAMIALDEYTGRLKKSQMFQRDGKVKEAEQELSTITTKMPANWRGWKNLGYFYINTQRADESIKPFQKYVELRPDTADSYDSLAEGFLKKKDYDQTIVNVHKALAIDPNLVSSIRLLAQAYELKGQRKEAKENYQKVLAFEKNQERREEVEKKLKELQ